MLQDLEANVGAVTVQQHDRVDERIKILENEIMAIKSAVAAAGQALPEGTTRLHAAAFINMKDAYAARDGCGAACGPGCGGAAGA